MNCSPYTPYQDDVFPPEVAFSDDAPEDYEETIPESWLTEDSTFSDWRLDYWTPDYWEQTYPEYFSST